MIAKIRTLFAALWDIQMSSTIIDCLWFGKKMKSPRLLKGEESPLAKVCPRNGHALEGEGSHHPSDSETGSAAAV